MAVGFAKLVLGSQHMKEIWGGVGISCIDWHPSKENLIAAVTRRTDRLELWQVDKGVMVYIANLNIQASRISWNPHNED